MSRYARALRLRRLQLTGWQRELFSWGTVAIGILLTFADLASPWIIVVLPLVVALVVKFHDVLAGRLPLFSGPDSREPSDSMSEGSGKS